MKHTLSLGKVALSAALLACVHVPTSTAALLNQNVSSDIIFGSGNANGGFAVDQGAGIEVGLRAKDRYGADCAPSNTFPGAASGIYEFDIRPGSPDLCSQPTRGDWNLEWSIISDLTDSQNTFLSSLAFLLEIDTDQSESTAYVPVDVLSLLPNYFGDLNTANGGGTQAAAPSALADSSTVAQQSWNYAFFGVPGYDPFAYGVFDFRLSAYNSPNDFGRSPLATTSIRVVQGTPPADVPVPATMLLLAAGAGLLRISKRL